MKSLDIKVIESAVEWICNDNIVWLCTVLDTFGSSPREPGSMLVAKADGTFEGSLSGGCVEEDFVSRVKSGGFSEPVSVYSYGGEENHFGNIVLPCGGVLEILIERLYPTDENIKQLKDIHALLVGNHSLIRSVNLKNGEVFITDCLAEGSTVERETGKVKVRLGPALCLIIAGISSVSVMCAEFAVALGFEVIICDPSGSKCNSVNIKGAQIKKVLPSSFIAAQGGHESTAIVALTHDPRIDDLAMMEAVRTSAFYIGVMGSSQTSSKRAERLLRSGGMSVSEVERLHMPIGLNLGSKTPAEIALAVMADIVRTKRGKRKHEL